MRLLGFLTSKYRQVYRDISDLPLYNWIAIHKYGDTKYMYIAKNYHFLRQNKKTVDAFENIYAQYFNKFVLNSGFLEVFEKKKEIAILYADAVLYNEKYKIGLARIKEESLMAEISLKTGGSADFEQIITILEKYLGFHIDRKIMSVESFYTHLNDFIRHGKENQKY